MVLFLSLARTNVNHAPWEGKEAIRRPVGVVYCGEREGVPALWLQLVSVVNSRHPLASFALER